MPDTANVKDTPVRLHEYFRNCACRLLVETPSGRRVFSGRFQGHLETVSVPGRPSASRAEIVDAAIRDMEEKTP